MQENKKCNSEAMPSENQLPAFLTKSIDRIAKQEGFNTYKVTTKRLSTDGGNYLAEIYEVDINTTDTNEEEKEINLFVKNAVPLGETLSGFFSLPQMFALECLAYTEISNIFTQLQNEANIHLEDRYKFVKAYGGTSTNAIILENVAKQGFKTLSDREKVIPIDYAELCIQEMAKFHALGFAIKNKLPGLFETKISTIENALIFNKQWKQFIDKWFDMTSENLSSASKFKIQKFKPFCLNKWPEYFSDLNCTKTLCHGDFKANNILAKHQNGKVTAIILVDYQLIKYNCPVNDIIYFMYSTTDRKFRYKHMKNLLNMYYDNLKNFLLHFDMNVTDVYPRKEFDTTVIAKEPLGLMVALTYYPFCFASKDNVPDVSSSNLEKHKVVLSQEISTRIEEIIEDLDKFKLW